MWLGSDCILLTVKEDNNYKQQQGKLKGEMSQLCLIFKTLHVFWLKIYDWTVIAHLYLRVCFQLSHVSTWINDFLFLTSETFTSKQPLATWLLLDTTHIAMFLNKTHPTGQAGQWNSHCIDSFHCQRVSQAVILYYS